MSSFVRMARVAMHLAWGFVLLGLTAGVNQTQRRTVAAQHWCQKALRIIGLEVVVEGALETGCLQVANHITWLDVAVMMSVGCRGFVSKSEVASWPLVGRLVRSVDTVFIERGAQKTQAAKDEMVRRLEKGQGVLFFPEGTTSDGRQVQKFHARLFEAALACECRVQPLAISYEVSGGDYDAVPYINDVSFVKNLLAVISQPKVVARLVACEPIAVAGYDRKGLARESRERIVNQLAPGI